MNFLDALKRKNTIENTKGGEYFASTYDANLDLFSGIARYQDSEEMINKFKKALNEDQTLALANLLYILDIREGKGERLIFKTLFRYLCQNEKEMALLVLPKISKLGRWDYILEGIDTLIDEEVVRLIKDQIEIDKTADKPSLLAKWLPSHRTHNVRNEMATILIKKLKITEKEYRKTLTDIRKKLRLIENNLSKKEYKTINFETIPTKAMLKYREAFNRNCEERYQEYLNQVASGEKKINTTGLYCYEIVRDIYFGKAGNNKQLYDVMWNNQKDFLNGYNKNILVMADTSGSMTGYGCIPYANSIGLAIYIAERNNGIFKNHFITFSDRPKIQEITGNSIIDKINSMGCEIANTNVDGAFNLLLNTADENNIGKEEMPSHIIIISDMEFDRGVYSPTGTNFDGWKKAFKEKGYDMPKIIFWNVACNINGMPSTKYDNDVALISGFSPVLLENLLTPENFSPIEVMQKALDKYVKILQEGE